MLINQKRRIKKSLEKDALAISKPTLADPRQSTLKNKDSVDDDPVSDEKDFKPFGGTMSAFTFRFSKKGKSSRFVIDHGSGDKLNMEED